MIYVLFFLLSVCYFLTVVRTYLNIVRAGNARLLLTEAYKAVALDVFILVMSLVNVFMGVREYLGLNHEHLSSMAIWTAFAAVAVHRLTEEIESMEARKRAAGGGV